MTRLLLWGLALLAFLWFVDRVLLWMERNGWINYRRRGLSRTGAAYHGVLLESIFNPAAENLIEAKYVQVVEEEDSGDTNRPERLQQSLEELEEGDGKETP